MRGVLAIAQRELGAYFRTPLGWMCLGAWLVVTGYFFGWSMDLYSEVSVQTASSPFGEPVDVDTHLVGQFFGNWVVVLIFLCPALCMRLVAEDRQTGSYVLLSSSPLSSTQIVLGKYLGVMGFVLVSLLATLHYPYFMLRWAEPDVGILLSSYLAVFLLASTFVAVGLLASTLARSQIVALLSSFAVLLVFWVMGVGEGAVDAGWRDWISDLSMLPHAQPMLRGLIQGSDLVYFLSVNMLLLFAAQQRLELERWQ